MYAHEVWGTMSSIDPLVSFFWDLFRRNNLIDIHPPTLAPTWKNKRQGDEGGEKRLDRFFITKSLINKIVRYNSLNIFSNLSDQYLIAMQVEGEVGSSKFPFKFKQAWLKEDSFYSMV